MCIHIFYNIQKQIKDLLNSYNFLKIVKIIINFYKQYWKFSNFLKPVLQILIIYYNIYTVGKIPFWLTKNKINNNIKSNLLKNVFIKKNLFNLLWRNFENFSLNDFHEFSAETTSAEVREEPSSVGVCHSTNQHSNCGIRLEICRKCLFQN